MFVEAEVANDDVTSKILNEIEKIDPRYSDLTLDVTINPAMPAPAAGGHGRVGFGRKLAEAYGTTGCFAGAEHGLEVAGLRWPGGAGFRGTVKCFAIQDCNSSKIHP